MQRLFDNWVYGGFLAAFLILGLYTITGADWPAYFWIIALQLPLYMLHQYEEHDGDRFRLFVNRLIGDGRDILTRRAVFMINIPGVWGVNLAAIALAYTVNPGFGLIAIWLTLLNGFIHVVQGAALRRYNPGLGTAAFVFIPVGLYGVWELHHADHGAMGWQMLGLGAAAAIHLAIIIHVRRRLKTMTVAAH